MTAWYDMALSPCVEVSLETGVVAKQDWSDASAKGGVFRLAVVPLTAGEAAVYLQVVPLGLKAFRAHLEKLDQDEFTWEPGPGSPQAGDVQPLERSKGPEEDNPGSMDEG